MKGSPGRLFHAVVVTRAALTASCERGVGERTPSAPDITPEDSSVAFEASTGALITRTDAGPALDASPRDATAPVPIKKPDASSPCPPGAEMPFPPCYYIR